MLLRSSWSIPSDTIVSKVSIDFECFGLAILNAIHIMASEAWDTRLALNYNMRIPFPHQDVMNSILDIAPASYAAIHSSRRNAKGHFRWLVTMKPAAPADSDLDFGLMRIHSDVSVL